MKNTFRPSKLMLVLLLGTLGLQPGWTQTNALPSLGNSEGISLSAERKLGDRIARELYRDPDYLEDPVLDEYIQRLWAPLVKAAAARGELSPDLQARFAWRILLGRDRSVNAFALPGGYLGVHLGLIAVVGSNDELASVLAHELSHVTQRHIARSMDEQSKMTPWVIGSMILGAIAISKNPQAAQGLIVGGQAAAIQSQLSYSRDMEREADRVGYGVLTDAGSVTPYMREVLTGIDALLLEFNHDRAMLMNGPYPSFLKQRVAGNKGHLSNTQAAELLGSLDISRLQHLVLTHLSETNNTPEHALAAASEVLGAQPDWLVCAHQDAGLDWRHVT